MEISYHLLDDREIFHQQVNKMETLHDTVNKCVSESLVRAKQQDVQKQLDLEDETTVVHLAGQDERDPAFDGDIEDSWIEDILEAPEELEGGTKMTGAMKSTGLKMTGLKTFKNSTNVDSMHKNTTQKFMENKKNLTQPDAPDHKL